MAINICVVQAFAMLARVISGDRFDSSRNSRSITIKVLIPNPCVGFILGRHNTKIREIQDLSGALLDLLLGRVIGSTDVCCALPLSSAIIAYTCLPSEL